MKVILFTLALLVTSVSISTAQTEKGRWMVGVQVLKPYVGVSCSYSKSNQRTQSDYQTLKAGGFTSSLIPTVGLAYFINRSVALNAGLNYVLSQFRNDILVYDASGNPIDQATYTSKYLLLDLGFQIFLSK